MARFAYEANAWGGVVGTAGAVTDLGSGFYETPCDIHRSLSSIAAAGFTGVELFDGNLLPFERDMTAFTDAVRSAGLQVAGVYSGGHFIYADAHEDELARFDRSIALAGASGAEHYVIGGGAVRSSGRRAEDFAVAGAFLDQVAERAIAAGLVPSYHPHLGSLAQTPEQIDALFDETSIGVCADVAHVAAGGEDPVEFLQRYADRLVYVHLKDLDLENTVFVPLGEGDLDMADIVAAVAATSYDSWITVENDGYGGDQDDAAKRSRAYLAQSPLA